MCDEGVPVLDERSEAADPRCAVVFEGCCGLLDISLQNGGALAQQRMS
jgi:hypothetical protein